MWWWSVSVTELGGVLFGLAHQGAVRAAGGLVFVVPDGDERLGVGLLGVGLGRDILQRALPRRRALRPVR